MTLGLRVKSGWAAAVLLTNSRTSAAVVDSRVIELADADAPHSRQPFHVAFGTAQTDSAKIKQLVRGIERFSRRSVRTFIEKLHEHGRVRRATVVVASLTDPASLANQHMRAHASEGTLFRNVLVDALGRCGVNVRVVLEREVYELLAKRLHGSPLMARKKVTALGETVSPWRAEQKVAAAGAWLVS